VKKSIESMIDKFVFVPSASKNGIAKYLRHKDSTLRINISTPLLLSSIMIEFLFVKRYKYFSYVTIATKSDTFKLSNPSALF